jgi:ABC-type uncharacterized transport system substrate-binding protein
MRDLGYIDGQTVSIQYRFWAGDAGRLSAIMTELVGRNVDVILAGDSSSSRAAKHATRTIPIVSMSIDPVGEGLVESLAHPEGNVTGFSFAATPTTGKLLEVLKETLPGLSRLGFIDEPELATNSTYLALVKAAAGSLKITVYTEHVRTASDFKPAFDAFVRARVQAVTGSGLGQGLAYAHRKTVIALALERRLPVAGGQPVNVRDGALIAFGANAVEIWARAATYIDRILKGTKVVDLPIEQPARYQLVVNQKTARTLGLTIPQPVLLRADQVIE